MFALPVRSTGNVTYTRSAKSRGFTPSPRETRVAASVTLAASGRTLEGYAAVFNEETNLGAFREVILPGAFASSMDKDIICLVDHDFSKVLGRTRSGTLRLAEDRRGLRFSVDLPDTNLAHDVLALVQRGDLGGCSFGFNVAPGGEHWQGKRRELRSVILHEISLVSAWPAYKSTSVSARSQMPPKVMALERLLRTL